MLYDQTHRPDFIAQNPEVFVTEAPPVSSASADSNVVSESTDVSPPAHDHIVQTLFAAAADKSRPSLRRNALVELERSSNSG